MDAQEEALVCCKRRKGRFTAEFLSAEELRGEWLRLAEHADVNLQFGELLNSQRRKARIAKGCRCGVRGDIFRQRANRLQHADTASQSAVYLQGDEGRRQLPQRLWLGSIIHQQIGAVAQVVS